MKDFEEIIETLINGNISDYKETIRKMEPGDLDDFLTELIHNHYDCSPEFIIQALCLAVKALR